MLMQIKNMESVFQANREIPMSIKTSPRKPFYKNMYAGNVMNSIYFWIRSFKITLFTLRKP